MDNILVIEDNDADANLIRAYLKESSLKHRLFFSPSLIGGLDIIEEDGIIDIVLLDLSLDDTSGYGTLTSYLEKVNDVPVVVLTGNKNQIIGNQSVSAGAQDFLVKGDFNSQRLVSCIKYAIQRFKKEVKLKELYDTILIENTRGIETEKIGRHGVWEMDMVNKKMSWSDALFRILDIPAYTLTPTKEEYLKIVHLEDKTKVEMLFEEASKSKEVIRIIHRVLLRNKQVKTIELGAKVKFEKSSNSLILYGYVVDLSQKVNSLSLGLGANINYGDQGQEPIIQQLNVLFEAIEKLEKKSLQYEEEDVILGIKKALIGIKDLMNNISNSPSIGSDFLLKKLSTEINDVFSLQLKHSSVSISCENEGITGGDEYVCGDYSKIANLVYATTQICIAGANANSSIDILTKIESGQLNRLTITFSWNGDAVLFHKAKVIYTQKSEGEYDHSENHRVDLSEMLNCLDQLKALIQLESKTAERNCLSLSIPIELSDLRVLEDTDVTRKGVKVLFVEDHFMRRISLRKKLLKLSTDLEVEMAESGAAALKYLEGNIVDLVLLDIALPGNESISTLESIVKNYNLPVIGLSSHFLEEESEKYKALGVSAYFDYEKSPEELFLTINNILE